MMNKKAFVAGLSMGMLITFLVLPFMSSTVFAKSKVYEANFQLFHNRLQGLVQEVHIPFAKNLEDDYLPKNRFKKELEELLAF